MVVGLIITLTVEEDGPIFKGESPLRVVRRYVDGKLQAERCQYWAFGAPRISNREYRTATLDHNEFLLRSVKR
jgi:hypothetical protein